MPWIASTIWPCVQVIALAWSDAEEVADLLLVLAPPGLGAVSADSETNTVTMAGSCEAVHGAAALLAPVPEEPAGLPVFLLPLTYADSQAMERLLERILPDLDALSSVTVVADPPTNSLLVEADDEGWEALVPLVDQLEASMFFGREWALPRVLADALATAPGGAAGVDCHVVEGVECEGLSDGLSLGLVYAFGAKHVEHGRRNGVTLRCEPTPGGGLPSCAVDWGWGEAWEPLEVVGG